MSLLGGCQANYGFVPRLGQLDTRLPPYALVLCLPVAFLDRNRPVLLGRCFSFVTGVASSSPIVDEIRCLTMSACQTVICLCMPMAWADRSPQIGLQASPPEPTGLQKASSYALPPAYEARFDKPPARDLLTLCCGLVPRNHGVHSFRCNLLWSTSGLFRITRTIRGSDPILCCVFFCTPKSSAALPTVLKQSCSRSSPPIWFAPLSDNRECQPTSHARPLAAYPPRRV